MYCTNCGKQIGTNINFCPYCGHTLLHNKSSTVRDKPDVKSDAPVLYHLPVAINRACDIRVFSDCVTFSGEFWYLRDKDFYRNRGKNETVLIKDFMGMGYLTKRSYRWTVLFVFSGIILELMVYRLNKWVHKVNKVLQWTDQSISLPGWIDNAFRVMMFLCMIFGIILFFSKKRVIEISFVTKRICIPQKSLSAEEFNKLRDMIKLLKEQ